MKYLISKLWIDSFENEIDSAIGYSPIGYVDTQEEAILICKSEFRDGDGWPIKRGTKVPVYRYCPIENKSGNILIV